MTVFGEAHVSTARQALVTYISLRRNIIAPLRQSFPRLRRKWGASKFVALRFKSPRAVLISPPNHLFPFQSLIDVSPSTAQYNGIGD